MTSLIIIQCNWACGITFTTMIIPQPFLVFSKLIKFIKLQNADHSNSLKLNILFLNYSLLFSYRYFALVSILLYFSTLYRDPNRGLEHLTSELQNSQLITSSKDHFQRSEYQNYGLVTCSTYGRSQKYNSFENIS